MSTVKADNFTWKSGESGGVTAPTVTGEQVIRGVAKAWLSYNGLAPSTRGSFNASSVTRNATGDYTLSFSTALLDINYCMTSSCGDDVSNLADDDGECHPFTKLTSSQRFYVGYGNSSGNITFYNYTLVDVSFFR